MMKAFGKSVPILIGYLWIGFASFTFAQKNIKGQVVDGQDKAVELVNVILFSENDTLKWVQAAATDSLGNFIFREVNEGKYLLKIQMIGFQSRSLMTEKKISPDLTLGKIVLETDVKLLNAVEVVGKRELIQKNNTGFVITTESTLSQQGGTAVDILRNTPTVFVDAEGGIILRGKSPLILINGRNSKLTDLANIPATSIEKIEIITNPSAEYDAEAENGIINIVFKKGTQQGFNGAFAVGAGYGVKGRFNSSALLNHKKGNWNLGLAYDNRMAQRNRKATGDRVNFNLPSQYYLTQKRNDDREEENHNLRLNLDFENARNAFNFEAIHSIENETNYETLFNTFETQNRSFVAKNRRFSEEIRKGNITELALNYERKLPKEAQKLVLSLISSFNYSNEKTAINTQNLTQTDQEAGIPFLQRTAFIDNSNVSNLRLDYEQKIGSGTFQTGYKGILRLFTNDFSQANQVNGTFQPVGSRTGILEFDEHVHAFYAQYKKAVGKKWDYEVGLRGEQTLNNGRVKSLNVEFDNQYLKLFPSVNVGYKITDNQSIRLLYAKRINRPGLGQLNPFTDITDSLTQRSGNPKLQPEITKSAELAYSTDFSKNSLTVKAFYRNGKNTILPFTVLQPSGVLLTTLENAGSTETTGFEGIFSYTPVRFWQGNVSVSLFHQLINAENIQAESVNKVLSWNAKWLNDFSLWKNAKLQVIWVYNSPTATIQGTRIAIYNVDLAFQQKLWKDKARLGLIVTDVFNTQKSGFTWKTPDFDFNRLFKVDTRAVSVTFAYTFGTKFKDKLMENKFSNE